jgi:ABC-type hemin transport system ATPase subunit
MSLMLQNASRVVNGQTHLHPFDLTLEKGTMSVLLGPTGAGLVLLEGIRPYKQGQLLRVWLSPQHIYIFDATGQLAAPASYATAA